MVNGTYFPGAGNVTTPVDMFQYSNTLTNDLFGPFILLGLWLILFLAMKNYPTPRAFASASFTTAIASYFMFIINLVPVGAILLTTIMTITSIFLLYSKEGKRK